MKPKRMISIGLNAFFLCISCAHAATEWHWNADGTGGDGNWGYTPGEKNWNTARENSPAGNVTWPDTGEDIAIFSSPTETAVTVIDEVKLNSIRLTGSELLLNAGTLRFTGADSSIHVSTGIISIGSVIDSENALTKSGLGTAIFSSESLYTSTTIISAGKLILNGGSMSNGFEIASNAKLEINHTIPTNAQIKNEGTLTLGRDTSVVLYKSTGGVLSANSTLAAGVFTSSGQSTVNGTITSNDIKLLDGKLSNFGTIGSATATIQMSNDTTLVASGDEQFAVLASDAGSEVRWEGDLENHGLVRPGGEIGTGTIVVTSALLQQSGSSMEFQISQGNYDLVQSTSATLAGTLILKQNGSIPAFVPIKIIDADTYIGNFTNLQEDLNGAVFFNPLNGSITRLGTTSEFGGNRNQKQVFASLYEDSVDPGTQNVTRGTDGNWNFTSGLLNAGDVNLTNLLAASLTPDGLNPQVLDRLSPEPYQGLHDYMNQSMKISALQARNAASLPVAKSSGKETMQDMRAWEFFASLDHMNGGSSQSSSRSSSQLENAAATIGGRKIVDEYVQVSCFATLHDGNIDGPLLNADASGWELGFVSTFLIDEPSRTQFLTGMQYGQFSFDGIRHSMMGSAGSITPSDAEFSDVNGTAWQGFFGMESIAYQTKSLKLLCQASLNFVASDVDSIHESGSTALRIDGFHQHWQYADLSLRAEHQLSELLSAQAELGLSFPLSENSEKISASFSTSGRTMEIQPSALIEQTMYFRLGLRYNLEQNLTAGVNWRCETWNNGKPLHNIGAGITWGF